jgi:trehalose 6-phosphate synthase
VPQLLSLLETYGGAWFFPDGEPLGSAWPRQIQQVALHPVPVVEEQRRLHYEVVSVRTLLWLFHYLHDTATGPDFDAGLHRAWAAYHHVNELFADRLAAAWSGARDEVVALINDYHFLLVPGMLARLGAPAGARVVYAHQVPWCGPDYFGILPAAIREQILTSLLSCDVVVFHSARWVEAFARCCDRYVPTAKVADQVVEFRDHAARLLAVPFPLDTATVLDLQHAEATQRWRQRLDELAGGRQLLVRVDRLDLWKNHLRGFAAYEALLRRHPTLADEAWFLAVVARPRYRSTRHEAYEAACRAAVARINQTAGKRGQPEPVTLLYPTDASETRHRGIAALGLASAALVNPTYDGFNLVAKEAALLNETAAILLSRTAGAYDQLAPAVVPLDPFDVSGTADALEAAIVTGTRVDPLRAANVRGQVRKDSAGAWLGAAVGRGGTRLHGE